jgi:hypothetical protein
MEYIFHKQILKIHNRNSKVDTAIYLKNIRIKLTDSCNDNKVHNPYTTITKT